MSRSAMTVASTPELVRAIAGFVASGVTLRRLLEAINPADLDGSWQSFLALVDDWFVRPNDLWPVVQYNVMCNEVTIFDIDTYFQRNESIDALRREHPHVQDGAAVGWMAPATINIARGIWTSCTLHLQTNATALDISSLAEALMSAPALRAVSVITSQLKYTLQMNPPLYVFHDDAFPTSLAPAVWQMLLQSHVVDLRLIGGSLLATSDGVKCLTQWLSTRPATRLHLSDVNVSATDATVLATALRNCNTLRELELDYDKDLVPAFLSQPLPRHLRRLRLFKSEPTSPHSRDVTLADLDGRGSLVVDALAFARLTHFSMDASRLNLAEATAIVVAALQLPRLLHLDISGGPRGLSACLVSVQRSPRLEVFLLQERRR
ncbi:hypothetical protein SDRG_00051 [Saprolegnia diclina VS20]|uniref:Uncharacterized protein n=1 Tax=Saprolegnia diclina (strain VS20) TaxID=1156394 RepID=T0SH49_SAPDV|nr:hypothetical protein SDRG_00051 [Saprolegnia diclina VS20]EQC42312.1 hypothetical protein SDRG_00051 [Saprolegnia diclina VS20]|eukprot:XP_008603735.1 hypothetical protein SDRG_00051 [Saprolegnia diclina VS20]